MSMKQPTIQDLPEMQRPYERFYYKGGDYLTDAELLSIIVGSGAKGVNAIDVSNKILMDLTENMSFSELESISIEELMTIPAIGIRKAIRIKAIFEIAKRTNVVALKKSEIMNSPKRIASYYINKLGNKDREELHVVFVNRKNHYIRDMNISRGSLSSTILDPRDVFREAIRANAASLVLVHNHPSGDTTPSIDDLNSTKRFAESGKLLGIKLLDHIIIGRNNYISLYADEKHRSLFI